MDIFTMGKGIEGYEMMPYWAIVAEMAKEFEKFLQSGYYASFKKVTLAEVA